MIATVQNVKKLIRYSKAPGFPESVEMEQYNVAENVLILLQKALRFGRGGTYVRLGISSNP